MVEEIINLILKRSWIYSGQPVKVEMNHEQILIKNKSNNKICKFINIDDSGFHFKRIDKDIVIIANGDSQLIELHVCEEEQIKEQGEPKKTFNDRFPKVNKMTRIPV